MGTVFKPHGGFSAEYDPIGKASTAQQKWQAVNYTSQVEAFAAIDAAVELQITIGNKTLVLDRTTADEDIGDRHYSVTAKYKDPEAQDSRNQDAVNNDAPEISFDITGKSVHITRSLSVRAVKSPTNDKDEFGGALGLSRDKGGGWKIAGLDMEIPTLEMSVTGKIPQPVNPFAFARDLSKYVGRSNSSAWYGWGPNDLLLRGARVGGKLRDKWQMNYRIACDETVEIDLGKTLGKIEKRGQDYLEVLFGPVLGSENNPKVRPNVTHAFSHVLYHEFDFTKLGMGG